MASQIFRTLAKGLFGRLLGYAGFALGFWLLYQGFSRPSPLLGVLGGGGVLAAMYFMVLARQSSLDPKMAGSGTAKEDNPIDSFNGSDQGGKLPP